MVFVFSQLDNPWQRTTKTQSEPQIRENPNGTPVGDKRLCGRKNSPSQQYVSFKLVSVNADASVSKLDKGVPILLKGVKTS